MSTDHYLMQQEMSLDLWEPINGKNVYFRTLREYQVGGGAFFHHIVSCFDASSLLALADIFLKRQLPKSRIDRKELH